MISLSALMCICLVANPQQLCLGIIPFLLCGLGRGLAPAVVGCRLSVWLNFWHFKLLNCFDTDARVKKLKVARVKKLKVARKNDHIIE